MNSSDRMVCMRLRKTPTRSCKQDKYSSNQIDMRWPVLFLSHLHTLIQRTPTVQTQPKTCRINFRLTILLLSFFSPSTALEGRDVLIGKMCRDRAVKLHNTCTVIWSPERTTIPCVQISHNTPRRCSKTATIPCVQMSHNTSQKQPQYHVELNSPMVEEGIKGGRTTSDHSSSNSNSNFITATTYNATTSPLPPSSPWQPKQSPTLTRPSLLKQPPKSPSFPTANKE